MWGTIHVHRHPVKNRFSYFYRSDSTPTRPVFEINYGRGIFTKSFFLFFFFSLPKQPGDKNNGALIFAPKTFALAFFFSFLFPLLLLLLLVRFHYCTRVCHHRHLSSVRYHYCQLYDTVFPVDTTPRIVKLFYYLVYTIRRAREF